MLFVALCVFLLLLWLARSYIHILFAFSLRFGLMKYLFIGESVLSFGLLAVSNLWWYYYGSYIIL